MSRMWRAAAIPAFMISLWLGPGCSAAVADDGSASAAVPASGRLLITGSSTMGPMIVEIGKRFQTLHPGVTVEVQLGGSSRGVQDAQQGKADIGMASRALTDKESRLYSFAIARDGVGLILHKDNPVRSLSNQQVVDIYTGKITNWSKVGGRNVPITVMKASEAFSSTELFGMFFKINYSAIRAQIEVGENPTRIKALLDNPNGIVYISVGDAERQAARGAPIKMLAIDGVAATKKNIRSGNFPISRPLLLLTKDAPSGRVKDFINFSLSSQVTAIVEKHDFVPYLD